MAIGINRKILIVDDNENMAALLSEILEVFDFDSINVENGELALENLNNDDFDMVITDLKMPGMSGEELFGVVKEKYPEMPVVVITGYSVSSPETQKILTTADGFLHKPFKVTDVEGLLKDVLKI
ncbi:MAG: response regulator [candidate division Zixibacteria bacterium]|nr:response regulator [candidate division Zixibacteria bacterium]